MTREDIKSCCQKISPGYNENIICDFADNVQTLGFIDTSQGQNGSRGIVFSTNHVMLNLDGSPRIIFYRNINNIRIIESYEDQYADELEIVCANEEFRINNCSLNKTELKSLLDKLCDGGLRGEGSARINPPPAPPKLPSASISVKTPSASKPSEKPSVPPRDIPGGEPLKRETPPRSVSRSEPPKKEFPSREAPQNEPQKPETLTASDNAEDVVFENSAPVISETVIPSNTARNAKTPEDLDDLNDAETRIKIQNMTPEETISFLAQSLSEINAPIPDEPPEPVESVQRSPVQPVEAPIKKIEDYPTAPAEQPAKEKLTAEPIWGDIYIKASRNLRELCESGRLSMKQIETELNDKLLDSTKAFAEITADESKIPKVLIPKITELKAAAQNFDQYFQSGDDIAARAMFFMMYQMLLYSDRIAETPETKERLNDFFRRFGTVGIMLSMLDMRV